MSTDLPSPTYCEGCERDGLPLSRAGYCAECTEAACATANGAAVGYPTSLVNDDELAAVSVRAPGTLFSATVLSLLTVCPECGIRYPSAAGHILHRTGAVLVGCQGYYTSAARVMLEEWRAAKLAAAIPRLIDALAALGDGDLVDDYFATVLDVVGHLDSETHRSEVARAFDLCWIHGCDVDTCLDDEIDCGEAALVREARALDSEPDTYSDGCVRGSASEEQHLSVDH